MLCNQTMTHLLLHWRFCFLQWNSTFFAFGVRNRCKRFSGWLNCPNKSNWITNHFRPPVWPLKKNRLKRVIYACIARSLDLILNSRKHTLVKYQGKWFLAQYTESVIQKLISNILLVFHYSKVVQSSDPSVDNTNYGSFGS